MAKGKSPKKQAEEAFAGGVAAIRALERTLDDIATSLRDAKAESTKLTVQMVDRFLLAGALTARLSDVDDVLLKTRSAASDINIHKMVEAGRQGYTEADRFSKVADRLGKVVGLLGKLSSARRTTLNADSDRHYRDFETLLANEYRDFASRENYSEEANAYADLRKVFDKMGELRMAPRLANRNICAVAGGFSSGKSSFLNALIGEDVLPTKITPTTSIPTYIFHVDGTSRVDAFNHSGGDVEIDADTFREMTHDFKRDHNVELKRLVHRVSIYTQALSLWPSLAFVDTPGYSNPEGDDTAASVAAEDRDEDIALANVLKSEFLIWIVDCEKGTLPEQDIHFIRKFIQARSGDAHGKLYLVFNKGDKKGDQDRQAILRAAEKSARKNEVPFAGIGIYSSHRNEWFGHQGVDFESFLQAVDQAQSSATTGLDAAVAEIFQRYVDYHAQERTQLGAAIGLLNRLALVTSGGDELGKLDADLKQRRAYISKSAADHEKLYDEALQLQRRFIASVQGFVDGIGAAAECP